jgi:plastocyanin
MYTIVALLFALAFSHPPGQPLPVEVPYPGGSFGQAETTVVAVENFRFCRRVCRPDSVAYLRTPAGPVPGSDNPRAVVYMQPGSSFTWRYGDTGCNLLRCPGHDIHIEDGTAGGRLLGRVTAETGHESLSWTIPTDAEPESIIRYFCARHASFGMTGAFQVLPIRVLSVSYPQSR